MCTAGVDQFSSLFRYYSLGGDAAMPGRLYARLCYTFLVYLIMIVEFRFTFPDIRECCNIFYWPTSPAVCARCGLFNCYRSL